LRYTPCIIDDKHAPQEHRMSSNLNTRLSQAYGLIEADQLQEAVDLLRPILAENPNNPDAWWLYAHAITDADDARAALSTVLNLDPNYPEAQRLLELLDEASRGAGNPLNDMSLQPIRTIPDLPPAFPEDDDMSDVEREFAYGKNAKPVVAKRGGFPTWLGILGLAGLFICALIAALLLSQSGAGGTPTATVVAILPADTLIPLGTVEPAVLTATALLGNDQGGGLATIAAAAAASPTPEAIVLPSAPNIEPLQALFVQAFGESARAEYVEDGNGVGTLNLGLCSEEPGVDLRETLRRAVELLAGQTDVLLSPGIGVVSFRLNDCATGAPWRTLNAGIGTVLDFATGALTAEQFEAELEVGAAG
jgi:tetratricopeptide (TPR) repeat protein